MTGSVFTDARTEELFLANIAIARKHAVDAVASGVNVFETVDAMFGYLAGMVGGRVAMIVPPHMIPPDELAEAVAFGRELAARYGW